MIFEMILRSPSVAIAKSTELHGCVLLLLIARVKSEIEDREGSFLLSFLLHQKL